MGLDQWCYATEASNWDFTENKPLKKELVQEVCYWRKHYAMHDWMEQKWHEKELSLKSGDFNCEIVPLSLYDLEQLRNDLETGIVRDDDPYADESYNEYDKRFVSTAIAMSKGGLVVYYDSWW